MIEYKKSPMDRLFDIAINLLIIVVCLLCLYPMLYVVFASVSDGYRLFMHTGPIWYPLGFSLDGYGVIARNSGIWTSYANTLLYVTSGTTFAMVITILGAYVLSRRNYKLKKVFTLFLVFTMYFNGGMIPTYLVVRTLGLLDSRLAMIIVGVVGTWNMIIMKTVFQSMPRALEEAAIIDGAGELDILTRIVLPVSKATIAVIILFYSVGQWNSWFNAMIYLQDRTKFPLQLILRELLIQSSAMEGQSDIIASGMGINYLSEVIKYATIVVATLPILAIYPFVQKYFVSGIMMGSLKE